MKVTVGLDLGSTAIKAVFAEDGRVAWRGVRATAPGQRDVARALMDEGMSALGIGGDSISGVAATGYGRKLYPADSYVDEITANAAGAFALSGGAARTVINIGGQDIKALFLDDRGQVTDFRMNDKCAAGTGRFFELVSRLLDADLSEFDSLRDGSREEVELNSTCVVFAESEIVSMMARGVRKEDIVRALFASVSRRAAALAGGSRADAVYLDGGPARHRALAAAMEDELMTEVSVLDAPQYTVAYGAAAALM